MDFLINEGFQVEDIANKLRVLSASQKTVEERIEKLRKLGLNPINLNVLCKSKKGFKKYYDSIQSYKGSEYFSFNSDFTYTRSLVNYWKDRNTWKYIFFLFMYPMSHD